MFWLGKILKVEVDFLSHQELGICTSYSSDRACSRESRFYLQLTMHGKVIGK